MIFLIAKTFPNHTLWRTFDIEILLLNHTKHQIGQSRHQKAGSEIKAHTASGWILQMKWSKLGTSEPAAEHTSSIFLSPQHWGYFWLHLVEGNIYLAHKWYVIAKGQYIQQQKRIYRTSYLEIVFGTRYVHTNSYTTHPTGPPSTKSKLQFVAHIEGSILKPWGFVGKSNHQMLPLLGFGALEILFLSFNRRDYLSSSL